MHRLSLATLVVLLAPAFTLAADTDPTKGKPYPLVLGHKWEYKITVVGQSLSLTHEITDVSKPEKKGDPVLYTLTMNFNKETILDTLSEDAKGVYRHSSGKRQFTPPVQLLQYPVKEDAKWTQKLTVGNMEVDAEFEIGKVTEVTVPAGKYMAYPVTYKAGAKDQSVATTTWYAEGVGIVKMEMKSDRGTTTMELTKFTPAKADK